VPSNFTKYIGKINPNIWLEDYHLACRVGGAHDDLLIIQFLPIYLADSTTAWLDHLSRNTINRWDDLWEVFTGYFQGTYVHPGNPCDLRGYRPKQGEPLWDYIRCFSQKCHALPRVADADVILAYRYGTMCHSLVHEFSHSNQKPLRSCLRSQPDMPQGRKPSDPPSLYWKLLRLLARARQHRHSHQKGR
jgi:hypothetical protein